VSHTRHPADLVVIALVLAAGVFVAAYSRTLPYWHEYAPGPGFFPFWLGVLLASVAFFELVRAFAFHRAAGDSTAEEPRLTRRSWVLALLTVGAALLIAPLGLILATAVFVAASSWTLDSSRRVANVIATFAIPTCIWLVFAVWLGVPIPRGPLGF
jgi:hypothetical protein